MNNWQDYVALQDIGLSKAGKYFYLMYIKTYPKNGIAIARESYPVASLTLSEEQVGPTVEQLLCDFPTKIIKGKRDLAAAQKEVEKTSRRGRASKHWKDIWFYKGSSWLDSPIIVVKSKNKYGVFKHPEFLNYGFAAERQMNTETLTDKLNEILPRLVKTNQEIAEGRPINDEDEKLLNEINETLALIQIEINKEKE